MHGYEVHILVVTNLGSVSQHIPFSQVPPQLELDVHGAPEQRYDELELLQHE